MIPGQYAKVYVRVIQSVTGGNTVAAGGWQLLPGTALLKWDSNVEPTLVTTGSGWDVIEFHIRRVLTGGIRAYGVKILSSEAAPVSGVTNLSIANRGTNTLDIASDTGTDATIPAATNALTGLMTSTDKAKLDGIEAAATADGVAGDAFAAAHPGAAGAHTAANIANVATGTIVATTVQAAVNELDGEKEPWRKTVTIAAGDAGTPKKWTVPAFGYTEVTLDAATNIIEIDTSSTYFTDVSQQVECRIKVIQDGTGGRTVTAWQLTSGTFQWDQNVTVPIPLDANNWAIYQVVTRRSAGGTRLAIGKLWARNGMFVPAQTWNRHVVLSRAGSAPHWTLPFEQYASYEATLTASGDTLDIDTSFAPVSASLTATLILTQGPGGGFALPTITYDGSILTWMGGVAPTLQTAANAWDMIRIHAMRRSDGVRRHILEYVGASA